MLGGIIRACVASTNPVKVFAHAYQLTPRSGSRFHEKISSSLTLARRTDTTREQPPNKFALLPPSSPESPSHSRTATLGPVPRHTHRMHCCLYHRYRLWPLQFTMSCPGWRAGPVLQVALPLSPSPGKMIQAPHPKNQIPPEPSPC